MSLFDDFVEGESHPLEIDDFETVEDVQSKERNIYAPASDGTALHRAIRGDDQVRIDDILKQYQKDFDRVKEYLTSKFQWNLEDNIWLEKIILVANSEEQCQNALSLSYKEVESDDLRKAILVLLKKPKNGAGVVVLHPTESNRLKVAQLIETLIPNGFLTCNYTGANGKLETFMETAASSGNIRTMQQLYDLGAKIAHPGHNPLIQACRKRRRDVIDWLLAENFDSFDCTLRDCNQYNALCVALQHDDVELFELILEKLMAYRQKYYNETESQAFSEIFRFESKEAKFVTIFSMIGGESMRQLVEESIIRFRLDLSYQNKNYSTLLQLLTEKLAVEYCLQEIRDQPLLLRKHDYGENTALHQLLRDQFLEFLSELYEEHPAVKSCFNTDGAFKLLRWLFWNQKHQTIEFILKHHLEFLQSRMTKLRKVLRYYKEECKKFPELRCYVEDQDVFIQIDMSETDFNKPPPLYHAVSIDDHQLVSDLLESGNDLNGTDHYGNHAMHHVRSLPMLILLIERHPDGLNLVNRKNSTGCTVLHQICSLEVEEAAEMLEMVIKLGANVLQLTNDGESALFFVRSCSIFNILRKHNLQMDLVNNDGETVLQRLFNNAPSVAAVLFSLVRKLPSFSTHAHKLLAPMTSFCTRSYFNAHYKDLLVRYPDSTKLMFDATYKTSPKEASKLFADACSRSLNYVVAKFLEFGYDLNFNYQNECLNTPIASLLSYAEEPNLNLVQSLLEKNVSLNVRNSCGETALLAFAKNYQRLKLHGHGTGTVQLLLDRGALLNTSDLKGNTPLHFACRQRDWELVDALIRNGADSKLQNGKGKTPLQLLSVVDQELFYFWE